MTVIEDPRTEAEFQERDADCTRLGIETLSRFCLTEDEYLEVQRGEAPMRVVRRAEACRRGKYRMPAEAPPQPIIKLDELPVEGGPCWETGCDGRVALSLPCNGGGCVDGITLCSRGHARTWGDLRYYPTVRGWVAATLEFGEPTVPCDGCGRNVPVEEWDQLRERAGWVFCSDCDALVNQNTKPLEAIA